MLLAACGGGGGGGAGSTSSGGGSSGGGLSISVSTSNLSFSAKQGTATPAGQRIDVTANGGTIYIRQVFSGSAIASVSSLGCTGSVCSFMVYAGSPDSFASAGTYSGTITFTGCVDVYCYSPIASGTKSVGVSYSVIAGNALTTSVSSVNLIATGAGTAAAPQNITLNSNFGSASWSSTIAYTGSGSNWLALSPASGGALPQSIVMNTSGMVAGTYQAVVTFTSGAVTKTLPVTLAVKSLGVNFVSPYVGTASVGGDVVIRGLGFQSLSSPEVRFAGTTASAITLVSDTEIRATYPALAAGNYAVTVRDASTTLPTRAQLVIATPPAFSYAAVTRTGSSLANIGRVIYDGERQTVLATDPDNSRLERYRYSAGTWIADSYVAPRAGANTTFALSPDGTEVYFTAGDGMDRLNAATLAKIGAVSLAPLSSSEVLNNFFDFENDGVIIGNSWLTGALGTTSGLGYAYDMLTQQLSAVSALNPAYQNSLYATADGSRIFVQGDPYRALGSYNVSSGILTSSSLPLSWTINFSTSRTGSRILIVGSAGLNPWVTRIYDASYTLLGTLPTLDGAVISWDGTKAYGYVASNNSVHAYNLSIPIGGGFAEIGTGVILSQSPGAYPKMTTSQDGGTLFLIGSQRLIVTPAP